jgi:hypothetical protein
VSGQFIPLGYGHRNTVVFNIKTLYLALPNQAAAVPNQIPRFDTAVAVTVQNETPYVFKPTAHAEALGFLLQPPKTIAAQGSGSGGEWGGQSESGSVIIPSVIQALSFYDWEEDPTSVLIFVLARTAGGDPLLKVSFVIYYIEKDHDTGFRSIFVRRSEIFLMLT